MATINVFISVHVDSLIHRYNVERAQSKKNVICTPKLFCYLPIPEAYKL